MRILHTADWHLGDSVGGIDRTEDLRRRVRDVAAICRDREVDVLVVAGDVFGDSIVKSETRLTDELDHLHDAFAGFFADGGTLLAITGNHDRDTRSEFLRAAMKLSAAPTRGTLNPGRMYLQNGPGVIAATARGEAVQFVLVPYPFPHRYAEADDRFASREEQNRAVRQRVAAWLAGAEDKANFDRTLPSVLVAHLSVTGSETHRLFEMTERDDVLFDAGAIPRHWAYAALGHIHKPQTLGGLDHVRYSGSLDRLRIDERDDDRGVVLVDVGPAGRRGTPEWIPLTPTPMHDMTLGHPDEIAGLAERVPDAARAIVRITCRHAWTIAAKNEATRALRRIFPRLLLDLAPRENPVAAGAGRPVRTQADYRATVRAYLAEKLAGDADAAAVQALVDTFLAEAP